MRSSTMLMICVIGILASISYCSGDTCYCRCCSGNLCTPSLQGTLTVSSCGSSSCKSSCQSTYPAQCTNGAGSASYQCTSDGSGGGGVGQRPNWAGTFAVQNRCDKSVCCCPASDLILAYAGANNLRVRSQFACLEEVFPLDATIPAPSDFSTSILFNGDPLRITLSNDSRILQLSNTVSPECSEVATRKGVAPVSMASINAALIFLLVGSLVFEVLTI